MFKMTNSLQGHYRGLGEGMTEGISFQAFPIKTVSDGADVTFCRGFPQSGSSDWKSSVVNG